MHWYNPPSLHFTCGMLYVLSAITFVSLWVMMKLGSGRPTDSQVMFIGWPISASPGENVMFVLRGRTIGNKNPVRE